jgi:type II secretory pathway component PulJ
MNLARHRHAAGGFTLLEVILAVSLTVMLVSGLFALYFTGQKTAQAVTRRQEQLLAQRLVMRQIAAELESALVYGALARGMDGQPDQATWPSAALPGPAAWIPPRTGQPARAPQGDVRFVGYRLRYEQGDDLAEPILVGLERTCQTILDPRVIEESEQDSDATVRTQLLSTQIRTLQFRYFNGSTWSDTWATPDLPAAVEITLGTDLPPGQGQEPDPATIVRRVVTLPASEALFDGGVRGLEGSP